MGVSNSQPDLGKQFPIMKKGSNTRDITIVLYKQLNQIPDLPSSNSALIKCVELDLKLARLGNAVAGQLTRFGDLIVTLPDHGSKAAVLESNFKKLPEAYKKKSDNPESFSARTNTTKSDITQYEDGRNKLKEMHYQNLKFLKEDVVKVIKNVASSVNPDDKAKSQEVTRTLEKLSSDIDAETKKIKELNDLSRRIQYQAISLNAGMTTELARTLSFDQIAQFVERPVSEDEIKGPQV